MGEKTGNLWEYAHQHGMTIEEILDRMNYTLSRINPDGLEEKEQRYWNYTRLNLQRMRKWLKTYRPSQEAVKTFSRIQHPMTFLVISEDWCVDAAQVIPCLYKLAVTNPFIEMRFIDRDKHPHIMDKFLIEGKRKIPIVVAIDEKGQELFRWGPRPTPAETVYQSARKAGLSNETVQKQLHAWYAADRCQTVEKEFAALLNQLK